MIELQSNETKLIGGWTTTGNSVSADDVAKRIDELLDTKLKEIAASDDGWRILYVDPLDKRYWELSYPHSELHGGGPPALEYISEEQAREKYKITDSPR